MSNVVRPNKWGAFPQLINGLHHVALGNGTAWRILIFKTGGTLHIGIQGHGCYEFSSWAHMKYVAEKMLGGAPDADCANLADFINSQLGLMGEGTQGQYDFNLTVEGQKKL